jgi:hypothetical protein
VSLPFYSVRPLLGASSSDLEVVSFESVLNMTPETKGAFPKVYAFEHGVLKLVGILPDGQIPSKGSVLAREGLLYEQNKFAVNAIARKDTVSQDGRRILFLSPAVGQQQLYLREDADRTVLVSESEGGASTTAENVYFQAATPDVRKIVFSTTSRLLSDDPGGGGTALYLYTDGPEPEKESNLTFVARSTESNPEELVKGISEDASHIYFGSEEALYLWDNGNVQKVAPGIGKATKEIVEEFHSNAHGFQTSADGRRIAFMSIREMVPGDSVRERSLEELSHTEIYVYDEGTNKLSCASCPHTGAAAGSGVSLTVEATKAIRGLATPNLVRYFSNDDKYVFFNTEEALVPQDVNGVTDAYEYNTETGNLSLLSPGTSEYGTWFVGAGANGRDVFLATRQQLSPWDPDTLIDVYDARAGGGLPSPPVVGPPCDGDACQGVPSTAPSFNTASEFTGVGNPTFSKPASTRAGAPTRVQRLKSASASCKKRQTRRKRARCEALARRRYRARSSVKRASRTGR